MWGSCDFIGMKVENICPSTDAAWPFSPHKPHETQILRGKKIQRWATRTEKRRRNRRRMSLIRLSVKFRSNEFPPHTARIFLLESSFGLKPSLLVAAKSHHLISVGPSSPICWAASAFDRCNISEFNWKLIGSWVKSGRLLMTFTSRRPTWGWVLSRKWMERSERARRRESKSTCRWRKRTGSRKGPDTIFPKKLKRDTLN